MFQVKPPEIALAKKLLSSDPADVAAVERYEALALRMANHLKYSWFMPDQHMKDSIKAFVGLERELAKVCMSVCGCI